MGNDKTDEDDAALVVNFYGESVRVTFDVKDYPVAGQDVAGWVASLDVLKTRPLGFCRLKKPRPQGRLGIVMSRIAHTESTAVNNPNGKSGVFWDHL